MLVLQLSSITFVTLPLYRPAFSSYPQRVKLHVTTPEHGSVLRKRFGLSDGKEYTLSEIGSAYDLSRERIRQIQEQALGKIRRALMRRNAM